MASTSRKRPASPDSPEFGKILCDSSAKFAASSFMADLSQTEHNWKCLWCSGIFATFPLLQQHITQREKGLKIYACHFCLHGFTTKPKLTQHHCEKWSHFAKSTVVSDPASDVPLDHFLHLVVCDTCGLQVSLTDGAQYRQLVSMHSTESLRNVLIYLSQAPGPEAPETVVVDCTPWIQKIPLKCEECDMPYQTANNIENHTLRYHVHQPYRCPECGQPFGTEFFFKQHLLLEHLADTGNLVELVKALPNEKLKEKLVSSQSRKLSPVIQCDLCGDMEAQRTFNRKHDCALSFTRRLLVDGRMTKCPGVTPQEFGFQVTDRWGHDLTASLKTRFKQRAFMNLSVTAEHLTARLLLLSLENKEYFGCRVCFAVLPDMTAFQGHMDAVHKATRDCESFAMKLNALGDKQVMCPKCTVPFCSVLALRRHLVTEHMQWIPDPVGARTVSVAKKSVSVSHGAANDHGRMAKSVILAQPSEPGAPTDPRQVTVKGSVGHGNWLCPICKIRFVEMSGLRFHLQSTHINVCYNCAACFVSIDCLSKHKSKCSQMQVSAHYFCYICANELKTCVSWKELKEYYNHLVDQHSKKVSFDDMTGQIFPMCGALLSQAPNRAPSVAVRSASADDDVTIIDSPAPVRATATVAVGKELSLDLGNDSPQSSSQASNVSSEAPSDPEKLCYFCHEPKSQEELFEHMGTHIQALECAVCKVPFDNSVTLIDHVVGMHLSKAQEGTKVSCLHCSQEFGSVAHAANHFFLKCHTGNCSVCGTECETKQKLNEHRLSTHKDLLSTCKQCKLWFSWPADYKEHLKKCKLPTITVAPGAGRTFPCTLCKKTFPDKDQLSNHQIIHMGSFSYCMICKEKFSTVRAFKDHLKHHKDQGDRTSIRASTSNVALGSRSPMRPARNKITLIVERDEGEEPAAALDQVEVSSNDFTEQTSPKTPEELEIHMDTSESKKDDSPPAEEDGDDDDDVVILDDDEIDDNTPSSSSKRRVIHLCNKCSQTFQTQLALNDHMRTHAYDAGATTNEVLPVPMLPNCPIYVCRLCCLAYENILIFKQHVRAHGVSHICRFCTSVCFSEPQLQAHEAAHSAKKVIYGCSLCLRAFGTEESLHIHLHAVHDQNILWLCKQCGHARTDKRAVFTHISTVHRNDTSSLPRHCLLGVTALRKLHYEPTDLQKYKAHLAKFPAKELPGECTHRSFLTYNETLLACDTCGTNVPASKLVLECDRLRKTTEQIKLVMCDDPYQGSGKGPSPPSILTQSSTPRPAPQVQQTFLLNVNGKQVTVTADSISRLYSTSANRLTAPAVNRPAAPMVVSRTARTIRPPQSLTASPRVPVRIAQKPPADKQVTLTPQFKCLSCDKVLDKSASLKVHQLQHAESHSWFCLECGISFEARSALGIHFATVHQDRSIYELRCPVESCAFLGVGINTFKHHLMDASKHQSLRHTAKCGMRFFTEEAMSHHDLSHSKQATASNLSCCALCGACFKSVSDMTAHMAIHRSVAWFMCRQCGLCFQTSAQLQDHFKGTHAPQTEGEEDVFKCVICELVMDDEDVWCKHMTQKHQVLGYKQRLTVKVDLAAFSRFIGLPIAAEKLLS